MGHQRLNPNQCGAESGLAAPAGDGGAARALPAASAKQAAYRARKRQAAQDLAAYQCAVIQQALQTRALADQCWELHELINAYGRDGDMPRRAPADRPPGLLAGTSAHFYGVAAARVRRHRRALQLLAHVQATQRNTRVRAERSERRPRKGVYAHLPHKDHVEIR